MVKSLEFFFLKASTTVFLLFFVLVKSYSILPVFLQHLTKSFVPAFVWSLLITYLSLEKEVTVWKKV